MYNYDVSLHTNISSFLIYLIHLQIEEGAKNNKRENNSMKTVTNTKRKGKKSNPPSNTKTQNNMYCSESLLFFTLKNHSNVSKIAFHPT